MERWELVCMCLLLPSRWGDVTAYLRANCKENGTQTPEGKPNAQRAVLRGGGGGGVGVRGAAGLKGERAGAGCLGDRKRETFSSRYSCPLSEPGGKAPS